MVDDLAAVPSAEQRGPLKSRRGSLGARAGRGKSPPLLSGGGWGGGGFLFFFFLFFGSVFVLVFVCFSDRFGPFLV